MRSRIALLLVSSGLALAPLATSAAAQSSAAPTPRVVAWRAEALQHAKQRVERGDPELRPALDRLVREADEALRAGPFTVTAKRRTPPSGDKRDYMSMGPYWWPDPTKPNGLPYIRRDGERNPESHADSDSPRWNAMAEAVETLALAYYFTGREPYAEHAARLLRVWFLDPTTRMNPHLEYGQAIPGITEGRGIGIIDTNELPRLLDAIALLEGSRSWSATDQKGMREWAGAYLKWLWESEKGRDERDEHNNHGTWYDAQAAALALFIGNNGLARQILESSRTERIATHVTRTGEQPHELARTRSLSYSAMNLEGMMQLAEMARHVGVDLWGYEAPNGGSIRRAIDYLAPYAAPSARWPHPQLEPTAPDLLLPLLKRAAYAYDDPAYRRLIGLIPQDRARANRAQLLF